MTTQERAKRAIDLLDSLQHYSVHNEPFGKKHPKGKCGFCDFMRDLIDEAKYESGVREA